MLVVMNSGKVDQIGPPLEVTKAPPRPSSRLFIGAPAMKPLPMSGAEPGCCWPMLAFRPEGAIIGIAPEDLGCTGCTSHGRRRCRSP